MFDLFPVGQQGLPFRAVGNVHGHGVGSDRHRGGDMGMGVVAFQLEIFEAEGEQILHLRIDAHGDQMPGFVTECKPPMRVFLRTEQIPVKYLLRPSL